MIFKALFGRKEHAVRCQGRRHQGSAHPHTDASTRRSSAPSRSSSTSSNRWWPRDYTWGKENLATIGIEPTMGGRCFERAKDGGEQVWGTVLAVDRPNHIVIAWQIIADRTPEDSDATSSRVDVRFSPTDAGKTDVLVVHRDFFRHGGDWEKYRNDMAGEEGLAVSHGAVREGGCRSEITNSGE